MSKPLAEFYKINAQPDGHDYYCKLCRGKKNHQYLKAGPRVAVSTRLVCEQMTRRGIPVSLGRFGGMPYTDIVAYGSIPVEAKSAKPHFVGALGQEHYTFHFTDAQAKKYRMNPEGFIVLVAMGVRTRYFVVPASDPVFDFSKPYICMGLYTTQRIVSPTNANVIQFENAFYQISEAIVRIAQPKVARAKRTGQTAAVAQPALF